MIDRGYTWTEEHRHACEVQHVLRLPTRQQRADYIDGVTKKRGEQAGERLRIDLVAAWQARRDARLNPAPPVAKPGHEEASDVHLTVNAACTTSVPVNGSFLAPAPGGNSDPDRCVVSGVAA